MSAAEPGEGRWPRTDAGFRLCQLLEDNLANREREQVMDELDATLAETRAAHGAMMSVQLGIFAGEAYSALNRTVDSLRAALSELADPDEFRDEVARITAAAVYRAEANGER